ILPFSMIRPPIIPASAKPMPPRVARSRRAPPFDLDGGRISGDAAEVAVLSGVFAMGSVGCRVARWAWMPGQVQYPAAKFHAPCHDLLRTLEDAQDLPVGQRDYRVR